MGAIADHDDAVEIIFVGDGGEAVHLLFGVDGVGLGDDVSEGDAVGEEVIAAYSTLGVAGVAVVTTTQGDDDRSNLATVETDGVVETSVVDGRRSSGVFGRSEDSDGVRGLGFVDLSDGVNLAININRPRERREQDKQEEVTQPVACRSAAIGVGSHGLYRA